MRLGRASVHRVLCFLAAFFLDYCRSLKDLRVSVPQAIRKGETAVLLCDFDLEGDSLYTVKWYKGRREFYRFTPKDEFPIKTFPIERIPIERLVDKSKSNMTQLTLVGVDPSLSGLYNCEVSAESPSFHTEIKSGQMKVVEVPRQNPRITGIKPRYNIGETLEAFCTSGESRPAANLTWYINGEKVHKDHVFASTTTRDGQDMIITKSRLRMIVKTHSFINGRMKLRCMASIHNVYNQSIEQEVVEEKSRLGQEATQIVVLPSNFLEKTEDERASTKRKMEELEISGAIKSCHLSVEEAAILLLLMSLLR